MVLNAVASSISWAVAARLRLIVWASIAAIQVEPDPAEHPRYGAGTPALNWRERRKG
jgi:hypothetical protein